MANHASAAKRHRQNLKRNERNSAARSRTRKAVRKAREAVLSKADDRDTLVKHAVTELYRAASKSFIKPGTASRQVGRLMKAQAKAR